MRIVDTDYLIIGSGVAGLYLALQLSEYGQVTIVTKGETQESNTYWAQGGVASVLSDTDSFDSHIQDTLDAGAGLCDIEAVQVLVREGPDHVRRLMELGANFEQDEDGHLDLGREGGHSANRIVHAADMTGREIQEALERAVAERDIKVMDRTVGVELITRYHLMDPAAPSRGEPTCYGAYLYDRNTWEIFAIRAKATVLATGGAGQVYRHNTNPSVATGDGVALGYLAGAVVSNMEFYQFHPTSLYTEEVEDRAFLISEALRGHGATLHGPDGEPFMHRYDERKELAPRDIVARAIDAELKRTGARHVWLDATRFSREELQTKFPTIFDHCLSKGIDISKQRIPVVPAAHYMCGGVRTDLDGRTNLMGLFAVGEVACTGVHGGNRLASNSLLEGLVFSARIAAYLGRGTGAGLSRADFPAIREWKKEGLDNAEEWILVRYDYHEIRDIMWNYVGIVRSNLRLHRALRRINLLYDEIRDFYNRTNIQNKILELRNLCLVARLIILSALGRQESRGLHFTTDYPENREPSREYSELRRTS